MPIDWEEIFGNQDQNGGGSSSSTSGSSSSGSSAPAGPSREQLERLISSYRDILRRWGLRSDRNLMNLMEKAARSMWSSTQFIENLRQTPEYRKQFRGLQWRTGMTEGQYLQTFAQYKARAQDIGVAITKREFAKILRRGVTFDEFSDRVDALTAIDEYGPLWDQFKQVLELNGVQVPGKSLTKKELTKFVMGLGSKRWEEIWEETYLTTQLERVAGIGVVAPRAGEKSTPDTFEITRQDLLTIIKQTEALSPEFELESLQGRDFTEIGRRLRQFDFQYMQRYGLSTKDVLAMEFGGPNAAKIAERAERVLATQEAFLEPRATPQLSQVGAPQEEELPQSL